MGLGASRQVGVKAGWRPAKGDLLPFNRLLLSELHALSLATWTQVSDAGDEVAQRMSQSGYDITPLTAQKKSELAELLTDHQR